MSILHFGEHHKDALQPKTLEFTEQFGSKAGILGFLRTFPDLREHILPGFAISDETLRSGNIPNLPSDFKDMEGNLIYRSSHPDDHRGYIGMLPTLFSRHHKEEKIRSAYKLSNHELNLAKVYNALAFFQRNQEELSYTRYDFSTEGFYDLYGFPLSDPRQSYESEEKIPKEFAEFVDADAYGYHIDYEQFYQSLLKKIKSNQDNTDYGQKALEITEYKGWSYTEMIKRVRGQVGESINHKEETGLRGKEKTGIYIQPEILPDGGVMGGICESPHIKGVYTITFRNPTLKSEDQRKDSRFEELAFSDMPTTIIFDSVKGKIVKIEGEPNGRCGFVNEVIELYKKVAKKEVFGIDYSFHMEFGFQGAKPLIYQIRQFSPYHEASFKLDIENPNNYVVRGITDEVGEKVVITLLGDYSRSSKIEPNTNIGIKYRRQELERNIPLRQRKLVTGTGHGRLDDDHGVTKLLYETGGIAVAGKIPGYFPDRNHDKNQTYTGTIFSDGTSIVMEGIELVG